MCRLSYFVIIAQPLGVIIDSLMSRRRLWVIEVRVLIGSIQLPARLIISPHSFHSGKICILLIRIVHY
jgi:hypothetical protein